MIPILQYVWYDDSAMVHYYGDNVRRLFIAGAILMAATMPFFTSVIPEPPLLSIVGIVVLAVAAGLTSPAHVATSVADTLISGAAIVVFEWRAATWYTEQGFPDAFFWTNQLLVLIFIFALYYSVKTVRGNCRP